MLLQNAFVIYALLLDHVKIKRNLSIAGSRGHTDVITDFIKDKNFQNTVQC